ncbi:MAG: putative quinol monooxygenase [Acidimicrobiales bacterium]
MIIIAGTLSVNADDRDAVLEAAKAAMAGTSQEEGNIEYVMSPDVNDPSTIRLFEMWESAANLAGHMGTDHMKDFGRATKGMFTGRSIKMYEIGEIKDL